MTTLTYTVLDAVFADGQLARGTDVRSRTNEVATFLNGANLDATNINMAATLPWTGLHTYTIANSGAHNWNFIVSNVLSAGFNGVRIYSNAAQVNAALAFYKQDNASSTYQVLEVDNDGSGAAIKATQNGNGYAISGEQTASGNSVATALMTQAGTGDAYAASVRTLTGLSAPLLAKRITTATTIDNTATETAIADLTLTIPANFLKAGSVIRGSVWGIMGTPGSAPATSRMLVRYGGTAGTILLDSGAITPTVSLVSSLVELDFILTVTATGASGSVIAQGLLSWNSNTAPAARAMGTTGTGTGNTATPITIDTTAQKDLVIDWKWGSAVASCTTVFHAGSVEVLK